jgi:formylmethanofuran dehydrogenase subunit E
VRALYEERVLCGAGARVVFSSAYFYVPLTRRTQVKAVGKIYHKGCLRCTECNALLDSNRLRDHDGQPMCVHCHSKLHGPQGLKK